MTAIQGQLEQLVGEKRVLDPTRVAERATSFWNTDPMRAAALVMPSSTEEIAGILNHCNQAGQAVLTQGGLTNCVAGVEVSTVPSALSARL